MQVAKTLTDHTPIEDSVARWGGEEFLIILPNSNPYEAAQTVDKKLNHTKELGRHRVIYQ